MAELARFYDTEAFRVFLVRLRCVNPHYEETRVAEFGGPDKIPLEEQHNEDYKQTVINPTLIVIEKDKCPPGYWEKFTVETLLHEIQKDERAQGEGDVIESAIEVLEPNFKEYAIFNVHFRRQTNIADARDYFA